MMCQVGCMSHDKSIPEGGEVKWMMWSSLGNAFSRRERSECWKRMASVRKEGHKRFINSLFERADMTISKQDWSSCCWVLHPLCQIRQTTCAFWQQIWQHQCLDFYYRRTSSTSLFGSTHLKFSIKKICHTNLIIVMNSSQAILNSLIKILLALMGRVINQKKTLL